MRQTLVARRLGTHPSVMSHMERGGVRPGALVLRRVAEELVRRAGYGR